MTKQEKDRAAVVLFLAIAVVLFCMECSRRQHSQTTVSQSAQQQKPQNNKTYNTPKLFPPSDESLRDISAARESMNNAGAGDNQSDNSNTSVRGSTEDQMDPIPRGASEGGFGVLSQPSPASQLPPTPPVLSGSGPSK